MNTTRKELRMLTDDILDYVAKKLKDERLGFKVEFKKELDKQKEEILIGVNKIIDRQ